MRSNRFPLSLVGLLSLGAGAAVEIAAVPAMAQSPPKGPVDIALVLAVDISYSMDAVEQRLQRDGYVEAFRDPAVQDAMLNGKLGRIAVTYFEWASPEMQNVVMSWTLIDSRAAANEFAEKQKAAPIGREHRTSISGGLVFAERLLAESGLTPTRRLVDVSGDGPNNAGRPVTEVRDRLVKAGVVINGLPIIIYKGKPRSFFDIDNLDDYYEDCVIGGENSFVIPIREMEEFATATRQKMLQEISGLTPPAVPRIWRAAAPKKREPVDCMIGERQMRRFRDP